MEHHSSVEIHEHTGSHGSFWSRLRSQLTLELIFVLLVIRTTYNVLNALVYGFISFIFEFPFPKMVLGLVIGPVIIYLVGEYLTLIPTAIVLLLIILSKVFTKSARAIYGVLAISVFYAFFHTFLV